MMNEKMIINEFIDFMSSELRHGECYFPLLAFERDYLPRFFATREGNKKPLESLSTEEKFYLQSVEVLHAHTGLERGALWDLLTLGEKANPIIAKLALARMEGLEAGYSELIELIEEREGK